MKKEMMKRALLGFPLGITWEYFITLIISLGWGNGYYTRCVPSLIETVGTEIGAVMLQSTLCGFAGMIFGAASVIWEIESWSICNHTDCICVALDGAFRKRSSWLYRNFRVDICMCLDFTVYCLEN